MSVESPQLLPAASAPAAPRWRAAPLLRAPESSRTVFLVTAAAAMLPLMSGIFFFGWRAAWIAGLSVAGCSGLDWIHFRISHRPAQPGRSHSFLLGILLALTLPPSSAWYVPLVASAFTMIVGKTIFGGVGHFLWQPALLGRLAVGVMFGATLQPAAWPLLAPAHVITGNANYCSEPPVYYGWQHTPVASSDNGWLLRRPPAVLREMGSEETPFSSIADALRYLPPMKEVMMGAAPGGIGESCPLLLVLAGLYLIHRNYVKWILPAAFIASAALVVAIAPVYLTGSEGVVQAVWLPIKAEGLDVGFTYMNYHLLTGELLLAAFFFAPEMTSRPSTSQGQLLFGLCGGAIAMLLQLYALFPLSAYVAVLIMNTFTPLLERATRPRVLGGRPWYKPVLRAGAEE